MHPYVFDLVCPVSADNAEARQQPQVRALSRTQPALGIHATEERRRRLKIHIVARETVHATLSVCVCVCVCVFVRESLNRALLEP